MKKVLMIAAIAVALVSCGSKSSKQGKPDFGDNEYAVRTIGSESSESELSYPATIKGVQDVDIRPKVSGFITKICVTEGQHVRRGQVLFEIDSETYRAQANQAKAAIASAQASVNSAKAHVNTSRSSINSAQAGVSSAQAQLNTAQLTYENSKRLHANHVIGDYELQTAKNNYETAKSALNNAQSGYESAKSAYEAAVAAVAQAEAGVAQAQAAYAAAKQNLDFCTVTSPANGVVGTLPYKVGALVSASSVDPLTTISDNSTIHVYFSLSEREMLELQKDAGSQTNALNNFPSLKLRLADGSIYMHEGRVATISGVIDQSTGSISLRAEFPNAENILKTGGAGQIIMPQTNDDAIVIPMDATVEVQNKKFVYIVGKDNKVKYTEITVEPYNDGHNYVVTSGLNVGDKIVIAGVTALTDGMSIKPITEAAYKKKLEKATELGKAQSDPKKLQEIMSSKKK